MKWRRNGRSESASLQLVKPGDGPPVLITGGAGFIGCNLAARLLDRGRSVLIYDNLSRPGVRRNLQWLRERHPRRVQVQIDDVRDFTALQSAVERCGEIYHFAAQVAVTNSIVDAMTDFDVNARGTLNVLEAVRRRPVPPPLIVTSTNKVYGSLADIALRRMETRHEPADARVRARGIGEDRPLDFQTPYGCSKGTADQYTLDYARTYGIPAAVFRMSCIYGPHQCGTEDQGWVAHFLTRALDEQPITVYGDGRQVRDLLYVDDLLDALELAQANIDRIAGRAFNVGGGPQNATSLVEILDVISELHGRSPHVGYGEWRPGDQRYYVSDSTRLFGATGWRPRTSVESGLEKLYDWMSAERQSAALAATQHG